MLNIHGGRGRLCDGLTRRQALAAGSLSALGLSLPQLWRGQAALGADSLASGPPAPGLAAAGPGGGKAKACIVLFLMGGPPQHSTWDPKPNAPAEVRGAFAPIATATPGLSIGELMPRTALQTEKICVLRALSSNDNAHSSSGYYMLTGHPHAPMNFENANPGAPNDYPSIGAMVRRLKGEVQALPAAITVPHRIFNTDGSVWPGQDAGKLGRATDPWLLKFNAAENNLRIDEFSLPGEVPPPRLESRRSLLSQINRSLHSANESGAISQFDRFGQRALDLLGSTASRQAFDLDQEPAAMRDRYGRTPFGNSVLLGRRLIEAGVSLVQVNWFRGPDEPSSNPCWDSHTDETRRLKEVLMGPMDMAYSALLEDLSARGLLDETLVVWMAEFGRSPKINPSGGRDHWGYVYSAALAGGGVRGGQAWGESDRLGGQPKAGRVAPQDLTATIFHGLGFDAATTVADVEGREHRLSTGQVISQAF